LLQVARALLDLHLQDLILVRKFEVKQPGLEQVVAPEEDLGRIEGLAQEVFGPAGQGALLRLRSDVGREHQDREERIGRERLLEVLHRHEPVPLRHVEVEQDQVGLELGDQGFDLARVGRALEVGVAGNPPERALEEMDVDFLVVDDQDPGGLDGVDLHHRLTFAPLFASIGFRVRHLAPTRVRYSATISGRRVVLIGLAMYPSQPALRARSSSPFMAYAVSATTIASRVAGSDLRRRVSSSPSMPGNWMSMRMRRGWKVCSTARASSASAAVRTSYPSVASRTRTSL